MGLSMRFGAFGCTGSGARAIQLEKEKFEFLRMEKISTVSEEAARGTDSKEAEDAARLTEKSAVLASFSALSLVAFKGEVASAPSAVGEQGEVAAPGVTVSATSGMMQVSAPG